MFLHKSFQLCGCLGIRDPKPHFGLKVLILGSNVLARVSGACARSLAGAAGQTLVWTPKTLHCASVCVETVRV